MALRGFAGAGQNMYIYPSIFKEFGGEWMKGNRRRQLAGSGARARLVRRRGVEVRAAGGAQLELARYRRRVFTRHARRLHRRALVRRGADESGEVEGDRQDGVCALACGPTGKRCTSIWNWGFPINAALDERAKRATWLFTQWAASAETQARTSWKFAGPAKRSGLNRTSLWRSPEFVAMTKDIGPNFVDAALTSLEQDTDVNWRPRIPQWPAVGDTMATAIQSALVGQKNRKRRSTKRRHGSTRY